MGPVEPVSDTGQAREPDGDWDGSVGRYDPLSVPPDIEVAEPPGDTVQAPDVAALERIRRLVFTAIDAPNYPLTDRSSRNAVKVGVDHALAEVRALLGADTTPTPEENPHA